MTQPYNLTQEDSESKAGLDYIARPCLPTAITKDNGTKKFSKEDILTGLVLPSKVESNSLLPWSTCDSEPRDLAGGQVHTDLQSP